MPEPKKVTEKEDESAFEAEEPMQPVKAKKVATGLPAEELSREVEESEESVYDELLEDFDGPEGTIFSFSMLTDEDNDKFACLSIDNVTIDMPLADFLALLAEIRPLEPELRRLSKESG